MRGALLGAGAILLAAGAIAACARPSPARSAPVGGARSPLAATAGAICRHAVAACAGAPPTYSGDVLPVLRQRCFRCHAGDGVAADEHDFSRVETLRAQKLALVGEVGACAMPPSPEPPLPAAEAETLLRWVACGALDR